MRTSDAVRVTALQAELSIERERTRRLEAQLRNLADHDPVTDLLNRRSLVQEFEHHLAGCARYGPEGSLLLVALDGIEQIDRASGRTAADQVLATLAELMADRLRNTDVFGRWAPDELAVLLPRAATHEVEVVADSLVALIGAAGRRRGPQGRVVASIGVAPVDAGLVEPAQLVARARQALEVARRRGGGWATADQEGAAAGHLS